MRYLDQEGLGKTHLVIGDAHAKPGVSNDRFEWLGKLVIRVRPDVVINMGDWADMASLCLYDKGKRSYEGRRYLEDIEAANIRIEGMRYPEDVLRRSGL